MSQYCYYLNRYFFNTKVELKAIDQTTSLVIQILAVFWGLIFKWLAHRTWLQSLKKRFLCSYSVDIVGNSHKDENEENFRQNSEERESRFGIDFIGRFWCLFLVDKIVRDVSIGRLDHRLSGRLGDFVGVDASTWSGSEATFATTVNGIIGACKNKFAKIK